MSSTMHLHSQKLLILADEARHRVDAGAHPDALVSVILAAATTEAFINELAELARITVDQGCYGLHWEVLDWNSPAIDLYKALGAEFRDGWLPVRLTDEALQKLAEKAS